MIFGYKENEDYGINKNMRVLIIGGGIAGPALGLFMSKAGIKPERRPSGPRVPGVRAERGGEP